MLLSALAHEAWVSIGASRLRTFLAMLGIVIGVGSVVMMLAVGAGSSRAVEESISQLGTNLLIVSPGVSHNQGLRSTTVSRLTLEDADAIAQLPPVLAAAPATYGRSFKAAASPFNWNTQVTGTTPAFFDIRSWTFADGAAFTGDDLRLSRRVVVIGHSLAGKLFPGSGQGGVVGMEMRINGVPFRIVGLLAPKGAGFDGRDQDDAAYIPITTAKNCLWGQNNFMSMVQMILVQAASAGEMDEASDDIIALMRQRHRVPDTADNDVFIRNLTAITQVASDTTRAFSLLLGAIASISLLVGGIGIMNIMLVNVSERTREIGIRKAIGATEHQILVQFLLEAVLIASAGSLIGLALGFGAGLAAQAWFQLAVEYSLWSVALAFGVAACVGVASGLYPAYKAARLQPIEALRVTA